MKTVHDAGASPDADILALGDQIEAGLIKANTIDALHARERAGKADKSVLDELYYRSCDAWEDFCDLCDFLADTRATTVEGIAVKRRVVERLEFCLGIENLIASVVRDVRDLRRPNERAGAALLASCPDFCF